jgi:DNA (cytosine-5)-methyltransferase 1
MDLSTLPVSQLVALCKERGIRGYSGKKKQDLLGLLSVDVGVNVQDVIISSNTHSDLEQSSALSTDMGGEIVRGTISPARMIDLCAGTGAFSYAFHATGQVETVYANDMVDASKTIYDANFTTKLTLGDLNDVNVADIPQHDIMSAGFPCQGFSVAGYQLGFQDPRSNIFWKILEIIDHHQPKCVILENVKNLTTHDDGNTFEIITKNLRDRGYHIRYKILDTAEITGIPQHRERIYIVCFKSKEVFDQFTLDFEPKEKACVSSAFQTEPVDDKYYYTDKSSTWNLVKDSVVKRNTIYQYRRVYVRENKSNECPTLTANMGGGGHNVPLIRDDKGIRKLTPRECFNFQGFPATYVMPQLSDSHLYKLAGNAVSVPVVSLIANRVVPMLV